MVLGSSLESPRFKGSVWIGGVQSWVRCGLGIREYGHSRADVRQVWAPNLD